MGELAGLSHIALGIPVMDEAHKACLQALADLARTPPGGFSAGLFVLIAGMERDFREEERLMEEIDFPALQCHRERHARVLSTLHRVVPDVMRGEYVAARKAIELLPQWFLTHLWTMDMDLAVALNLAGLQSTQPAGMTPQIDTGRNRGANF